MSLHDEPMLLEVDSRCAPRADDPHAEMSLNRVHPATQIAPTFITASLHASSEVVSGVLDRTPATVAVGHALNLHGPLGLPKF